MSQPLTSAEKLIEAANLIERSADKATDGPWWSDQSDETYRLHGVAGRMAPVFEDMPEQVVNSQILKAPKKHTVYAEYWPNEADDLWITAMNPEIAQTLSLWLESESQASEPSIHAIHFAELVVENFQRRGFPPVGA